MFDSYFQKSGWFNPQPAQKLFVAKTFKLGTQAPEAERSLIIALGAHVFGARVFHQALRMLLLMEENLHHFIGRFIRLSHY